MGQHHCSALSKPSATFGQQQCEAAHGTDPTSNAGRAKCDEAGHPALYCPFRCKPLENLTRNRNVNSPK